MFNLFKVTVTREALGDQERGVCVDAQPMCELILRRKVERGSKACTPA